jgi:CHAT domain-containing protein
MIYEKKVREARAQQDKKDQDARKRDEGRARRAAADERRSNEREERERAAREAAREREVLDLRERTDELEQQLRAARLAAPKEICVLFIAGTIEGGKHPLHLDREIREIDLKVRASEYRDQLRFEHLHATQIRDILDGLNRYDPDVVHFSGHGDRSSLLFEGPDGRPHELRDDQLGLLLQVARKPIRLVVLNACESADQAALATDYVDAAIGMAEPIDDDTAKVFAGQFYASLAAGNSLASAFDQARVQARMVNDDEEAQPRLFVREGLDADEMVLVAP